MDLNALIVYTANVQVHQTQHDRVQVCSARRPRRDLHTHAHAKDARAPDPLNEVRVPHLDCDTLALETRQAHLRTRIAREMPFLVRNATLGAKRHFWRETTLLTRTPFRNGNVGAHTKSLYHAYSYSQLDASAKDQPIVWVSRAFEHVTGFENSEVWCEAACMHACMPARTRARARA
eukprot:5844794-Pleurochrysis_carterae.AAC.1